MKARAWIASLLCLGVLVAPLAASSLPLRADGPVRAGGVQPIVKIADMKKKLDAAVGAATEPTTGTLDPGTGGGTVVYATSSIKCGKTIYEVSDGGKGGCMNMPNQQGVYCSGNNGKNWAGASCAKGCEKPKGQGTCTVKSAD